MAMAEGWLDTQIWENGGPLPLWLMPISSGA
jgi:hypothetical protein